MTEHYYSKKPLSKSKPKTWTFNLLGRSYSFTTDLGVFSKHEVDFGTRLLIDSFEEPKVDGDILDLGCGYGPIGISIADHYERRKVIMVDVNERAIKLAEQNLKDNHIKNAEVLYSEGFAHLSGRKFSAILTNPPIRTGKKNVYQMFEDSKSALVTEGELWVVIQKKQGAPSAKKKLEELFSSVKVVSRRKGYYVIRAQKI